MAQRLKVLVVDDDPVTLEVTKAVLEDLGHTVLTRGQALGTTPVAIAERPDVIVLDVRMPGLSGGELLGVIREGYLARNAPPPCFILYSGLAAEALTRLVEEKGALGAIEKSGNPKDFARSFAELTKAVGA